MGETKLFTSNMQSLDKEYAFEKVYQALNISAKLKSRAEDFIVEENISLQFSGEGEHCWVYIKKRNCNTDWVAQQLSKFCQVKPQAVSYAGLKDRRALTSQWFSVQLPGKPTPDWKQFEAGFLSGDSVTGKAVDSDSVEGIQVLQSFRHNKKLQRGALKSNHFEITLRELSDTSDEMFALLQQRCLLIGQQGVPNYFGKQRFGRNYNNLDQAVKMFTNPRNRLTRQKRSMYLSAARSWMFNIMLSERIKRGVWNARLPGDVFMLDGRSACFKDGVEEEGNDKTLDARLLHHEIHPTAILWGEGDVMVVSQAAVLESDIINQFPVFRDGLIAARLQAQRRACRVVPANLQCHRLHENFVISFDLPSGCYATMVLAEIFPIMIESVFKV